MAKVKTFLFTFLITAFSIMFIAGCGSSSTNLGGGNSTGTDNGTGGDNSTGGDNGTSTVTPIDLVANPFSLLGVYKVDLYGVNEEPVSTPIQASELRVGLNLTTAAGGINAPEVLMLLNYEGQIVPFANYIIDLSNMGSDLEGFIATTFTNLGAELIEGEQYGLYFKLDPAVNSQYQPLIDKGIISEGQYLKLKLTKTQDIAVDKGLGDIEPPVDPEEPLEVTDISFDKSVHQITQKESFKLQTYFSPIGATSNLTWETSDPQVATVDNTGMVTIVSNGNATITATTENGKKATLEIKEAVLGEISLDKNELTLYVNNDGTDPQTHQLVLSGVPEILGATVTYETDNGETVVSVSQTGLITAKSAGTANVTVKVIAGGVEKTAVCVVNVSAYPEGIVFEQFDYGVALGGTRQIQPYLMGTTEYATPVTYSTDKGGIIEIDSNGNITTIQTGDVVVTATYSVGSKSYTATCNVGVYTPIDITKPETLVGTYEFVEFTSDSSAAFNTKVYVGTKNESKYKDSVQRMIGEMSLNYASGSINMTTKIQMESPVLEDNSLASLVGIDTKVEQLALTTYEPIVYAGGSTSFGSTGSQQTGVVTKEGDMLLISQEFTKGSGLGKASVIVKTYVRKKSDTPKQMNNLRYFDYMDFEKNLQSNGGEHSLGDGAPEKEPYYSYGVVTYSN